MMRNVLGYYSSHASFEDTYQTEKHAFIQTYCTFLAYNTEMGDFISHSLYLSLSHFSSTLQQWKNFLSKPLFESFICDRVPLNSKIIVFSILLTIRKTELTFESCLMTGCLVT